MSTGDLKSIGKLRELCAKWRKTSITPGRNSAADEVDAIADDIEQEIAERYMELPVDADGVPWHMGDEVRREQKDRQNIVTGIYLYADGMHKLHVSETECTAWAPYASKCRHVKPRTIEDVLRDCCNEWNKHCGDDWESGVYAKYAEEIREMMA